MEERCGFFGDEELVAVCTVFLAHDRNEAEEQRGSIRRTARTQCAPCCDVAAGAARSAAASRHRRGKGRMLPWLSKMFLLFGGQQTILQRLKAGLPRVPSRGMP